MTRTRLPVVRLSELTPDQYADCFALLVEKKHGTTQVGKPFYACRFRDDRRVVSVMIWAEDPLYNACQHEWQEGQCFKIRGTFQVHEKYGPQLKLEKIRPAQDEDRAEGFDPTTLVEHSRFAPDKMMSELRGLVEQEITDLPLRRLVLTLLEHHARALALLPASLDRYFPFPGGLLEHTLSVARSCLLLVNCYRQHYPDLQPPLNRDLVLAAAVLHEIGRVRELDAKEAVSQPTVMGKLFGHVILGRDLVREAAAEQGDLHPELLQLLEHLLVSYLTLPEWGSPRLPMIPEVLILHHADDLDCKLEMYLRCLRDDKSDGPFTDRDPFLGKQLLKTRTV